ncbi:hypothetical protein BDN72DRAFT_521394 [Pluteus cervinus]|uniref:Uncharacterized protein n=1 Tax=Pluteus cervinus TaxID=181527 RepID=A0ACD3AYM8_9AGAR|nr:hypothetical protein BDN72DRAFT_521394 [Pluteus cervinus]
MPPNNKKVVKFNQHVTEVTYPQDSPPAPHALASSSRRAGPSTLREEVARRVLRSQPLRHLRAPWDTYSDTSSSSSPSPPVTPRIPTIPLPGTASTHFENIRIFVWGDVINPLKAVANQPATNPPCQSMTFVDQFGVIQDMVITAEAGDYIDIRDVVMCLKKFVSGIDKQDWEDAGGAPSDEYRQTMVVNWKARKDIMGPNKPTIIDMDNRCYFIGIEALEDGSDDRWVFNFSA